jgi:two-component system response regulator HydG
MNAVERAVVLSRSDYLVEEDFPMFSQETGQERATSGELATPNMPLEEVEKATILKTLESTGGNKSEAARRLGITRRTLHKKLKKYGVMP